VDNFSFSVFFNQIPQTGRLLNKRKLHFTVIEAGNLKFNVPVCSVSSEGLASGTQKVPSNYFLIW
jgi:hypothetical protein